MNREEFLAALEKEIGGLPQEDRQRSLEFYAEAIDDRMESGMTEEEAVASLGSVKEIARQILEATPLPRLIRARVTPSRSLRVWEIILLVLGSPVWFSLLLAAAAVALSVYVAIWSVVLSVYAVVLALAVSGVVAVIRGFGMLMPSGIGLVLMGLSILLFFGANRIAKGILCLSKSFALYLKSLFTKKEEEV